MSPFKIKIMLHHYTTTSRDYNGEENKESVASAIQELAEAEMLHSPPNDINNYTLTEKGIVYARKLMSIPYPIATTVWAFPEDDHDI